MEYARRGLPHKLNGHVERAHTEELYEVTDSSPLILENSIKL